MSLKEAKQIGQAIDQIRESGKKHGIQSGA